MSSTWAATRYDPCRFQVAQDDEPQLAVGHAGFAQRHVFGYRIVFAIAAPAFEDSERRAPAVGNAPLGEIAGRQDGEIDRAVDHAEAGAPLARASVRDDGEEFLRRLRAVCGVGAAAREDFAIAAKARGELVPFVERFTVSHWHCIERERLRWPGIKCSGGCVIAGGCGGGGECGGSASVKAETGS